MIPQRFHIVLTLATILAACSPNAPVSKAINDQLPNAKSINIANLTSFTWEKTYVFSPYTPRKDICTQLVSSWKNCESELPEYINESTYLLAFMNANELVHFEMFHRQRADFCEFSCALVVQFGNAVFTVNETTSNQGKTRYRLSASAA